MDEFLTDARNVSNRSRAEMLQSPDPSPRAQPASDSLSSPSKLSSPPSFSISAEGSIYTHSPPPYTTAPPPLLNPLIPLLHRPFILRATTLNQVHLPPPLPLPPPSASPTFASMLGEQSRSSTICTSCAEWGSCLHCCRQKEKEKVSKERHESKQQAQRCTGVNIDCRWAPPGIAKFWASLPKQGVAMITISQRTTGIIGEPKMY